LKENINQALIHSIKEFNLPSFETIPDVGLYLEQTVRFLSDYLSPLPNISITSSMVGNYVKKKLIDNPVKKLYNREQIAYLLFIAIAKSVLSLEDIQLLIYVQKESYPGKTAYEYFVREFMNVLHYVFGIKESLDEIGTDDTHEKALLRNTITAIAYKIYLDKSFELIHENTK